jgi:hypothetical protein
MANTKKNKKIVTRSLNRKYGCIGILSEFESRPNGLLLPCVCSVIKCIIASADSRKGSR